MDDVNYSKILDKISKSSGLEREEIERRVEAKRARLSGLISLEGAAQVVAAELGISFENERFKIDELLPGMRKVNIIGKVLDVSPVRTFTRNDKEGKVVNLTVADETSNIKVVLWDTNHIDLIEKGQVSDGSVVEISNASMRETEIHLGSFSEFKISSEAVENVKTEKIVRERKIIDLRPMVNSSVRAFVVQVFEPRFFEVCPECNKKISKEGEISKCAEHGVITPSKRALVNVVLDDGTETIRSVLFHENIPKIGIDVEKEDFPSQKENLIGKEMLFIGNARNNSYSNTTEFIIEDVKELDLDSLVSSLEK